MEYVTNQNIQNQPFEEIYDFGIKVQWFPALVAKYPDRLEEIATRIIEEVDKLGSVTIYLHRFRFEDEQVMIVTSWDEELDILFADADLVAYQEIFAEADINGDGEDEAIFLPIPASEASSIH